jgi:hypothetical protein
MAMIVMRHACQIHIWHTTVLRALERSGVQQQQMSVHMCGFIIIIIMMIPSSHHGYDSINVYVWPL